MNNIIKRAIVGGAASALIMGMGTYFLGELSGYKAKELLTSSLSGINMLCNTVISGIIYNSSLNAYPFKY